MALLLGNRADQICKHDFEICAPARRCVVMLPTPSGTSTPQPAARLRSHARNLAPLLSPRQVEAVTPRGPLRSELRWRPGSCSIDWTSTRRRGRSRELD